MTSVPSFSQLKANFPYKPANLTPDRKGSIPTGALVKSNKDLIEFIGGDLRKRLIAIQPDLDLVNTCAIRLSYCLNQIGSKITKTAVAREYKGGDGNWYLISADEMIAYLRKRYGAPIKIFDGTGKDDTRLTGKATFPTQGIIGYDWQGKYADFGASGHVDIGRLPSSKVDDVAEIGTGAYFNDGRMKVYLWPTGA